MPTLTSPGGHVYLEMEASLGWRPDLCEQRAVYALEDVLLKPGEAVPLIGKGEFANGLDGWWEYPVKEVVRLRAGYKPSRENVPTVFSEWVEVKVEQ